MLAPSLLATFVYVFVFTGWTLYISLSNSSLLPTYTFVGFEHYRALWAQPSLEHRLYEPVRCSAPSMSSAPWRSGLLLAILIDQRVRGEAIWRTIFLYPLAVSFIVTGTVWGWLYSPTSGIEFLVRSLGWTSFRFAPHHRPQLRHLRHRADRHLAVLGLRHGAVPRRPALGRPRPHQGRQDRRRRHGPHLPQGGPADHRAALHRGRGRAAAISPSRPSISPSRSPRAARASRRPSRPSMSTTSCSSAARSPKAPPPPS